MVERNEILSNIEKMINLLTNPLDDSEIKNGWDPALQARWKIYYQKMYEYIKAGKPLSKKPEYTASIVRAYDCSGIMQGKLLDHAINIQCQVRQIAEKEKLIFKYSTDSRNYCSSSQPDIFFFVIPGLTRNPER